MLTNRKNENPYKYTRTGIFSDFSDSLFNVGW
ncbi:hypothetical protein CLV58_101171 [Spirosoma oryzae]|uniref:Uncharacterized protein n=1 Tax=Spirosoma oryzae TaxID=1469603 RepID=A0A2T0TN54_9BACT|nr:hypothetical protein CLV58_101171 [Spirosoma oryzae]